MSTKPQAKFNEWANGANDADWFKNACEIDRLNAIRASIYFWAMTASKEEIYNGLEKILIICSHSYTGLGEELSEV